MNSREFLKNNAEGSTFYRLESLGIIVVSDRNHLFYYFDKKGNLVPNNYFYGILWGEFDAVEISFQEAMKYLADLENIRDACTIDSSPLALDPQRSVTELERALFNWYYSGEDADAEPVFNAMHSGMANNMQVLVPVETPTALLEHMGDPRELKPGDTFSTSEDISLKFHRFFADDKTHYFMPLFTCEEEKNKGEAASAVTQSFKTMLDAAVALPDCLGCIINPWDHKIVLQKEMIKMLLSYEPRSHITFVRGSVADLHVGAIVNSASRNLQDGGGVNGAIHRAAGSRLETECSALHGCNTGEAKITDACDIKHADYIIHTVGPYYSGEYRDAAMLSACYENALDLALRSNCSSIAFPCISTGARGYPPDEAAKVSLLTAVQWFEAHPDVVMNVYFCCFKDSEFAAYAKLTEGLGR